MQDFSIHRMFEISLHEFCFTIFHWEKTSPLVSHVSRMDMVNMCLGIQGGFGATCPEGKVLMQPSLACWTTTMGHINSRSTNIRLPENKVLPNLMVNDLFPDYRVVIFGVYPHFQTHQTLWNSQFAQVKSPCLMVISSKSTKWGFLFFQWFNQTSAGQHVFLGG